MDYPIKILSQLRPILIGFRKSKGLTQTHLAKQLGITQQSYAKLEADPTSVSVERLFKILQLLDVEMILSEKKGSKPNSLNTHQPDQSQMLNSPSKQEDW